MTLIDRRGVLGGVALGAGAGGLLLAGGVVAKPQPAEVTANEDLMREHGVLRRILILYREAAPKVAAGPAGVDASAINSAAQLFKAFGEDYHEEKLEEQHIFPAVAKTGGPAASLPDLLRAQHKRGREITAYIIDATSRGSIAGADGDSLTRAMLAFARMYEAHSAREDTVVFPAFRKALSKRQYEEIGDRFEDIERQQFGGDGFDMALAKIAAAEQTLGIAVLSSFTAPAPPPLR